MKTNYIFRNWNQSEILIGRKRLIDLLICLTVGFFGGFVIVVFVCRVLGFMNDVINH